MARTLSTAPAVIDYLVQQWTLLLPDVLVSDGEPLDPAKDDILVVGFTGTPGESVVQSTLDRQQMSSDPDRERYDLACLVSCWRGNQRTTVKQVRDKAYEIIAVINDGLVADQMLGGLCMRARLSVQEYAPLQNEKGAVATVHFIVNVDAYTRASGG